MNSSHRRLVSTRYSEGTVRRIIYWKENRGKSGFYLASNNASHATLSPVAPLQFGLGVKLYHHFASRFLVDSLHHHGFCCSYQEVQRLEHNAAQSHGTDIPNLTTEFVQYGADNVDHNICTLDGQGTFHGMGMIAIVTPEVCLRWSIPRAHVTSLDVAIVGRVQIHFHKEESSGMSTMTYQKLLDYKYQDRYENLDVQWKAPIMFGAPRPVWSGMMQFVQKGHHPGKTSVMFLP